ncbi:hypothetical protein OG871_39940 (plasmid) [Kitasatospora sp. NBC_00374]|uniref:hypothetical protein n=1 Tax=Kitasatospora sp. NBC_00374 TaxID=2975964 RepID=UPI002F913898
MSDQSDAQLAAQLAGGAINEALANPGDPMAVMKAEAFTNVARVYGSTPEQVQTARSGAAGPKVG